MFTLTAFSKDTVTLPMSEGRITFSEIVNVPNTTADTLYTRAKLWAATTYVSAPDAIKLDSKADGVLLIKGYSDYGWGTAIYYELKIEFKDGRYRYTITNLLFSNYEPVEKLIFKNGSKIKVGYGGTVERIYNGMQTLISSLKEGMSKTDTPSNW